jgi:hypothetical protein
MHAQKDFEYQIELEEEHLTNYLDKQLTNDDEEEDKKIKELDNLILESRNSLIRYKRSRRFHYNAHNCYWYWLQMESNKNQERLNSV